MRSVATSELSNFCVHDDDDPHNALRMHPISVVREVQIYEQKKFRNSSTTSLISLNRERMEEQSSHKKEPETTRHTKTKYYILDL